MSSVCLPYSLVALSRIMRASPAALMFLLGVTVQTNVVRAAIVTQFTTSAQSQTAFPVSGTDLINQGQTTLAGQSDSGYVPSVIDSYGPTSRLNDGDAGGDTGFGPSPGGVMDQDGTWSVTFQLNTATSPLGYDIHSVETFTGHRDNRKSQKYELLVSQVNDASYVSLGLFQSSFDNWQPGSTRLAILDDGGSPIATNVDAVRFAVQIPPSGSATVYREFDVYGVQSVPEPSSMTLLLVGAVGLVGYGCRRLWIKAVVAVSTVFVVSLNCCSLDAGTVVLETHQWASSSGGNDRWYQLIEFDTGPVTWHTARNTAATLVYQGRYGHLATFSNDDEWLFVRQNLLEPRQRAYDQGWIGATDEVDEGVWKWITGENWTWSISTDYNSGYTAIFDNLNNEDYGLAWLFNPPIKWNDVSNDRNISNRAVVEYGGAPIPEPSSLAMLALAAAAGVGVALRRRGFRARGKVSSVAFVCVAFAVIAPGASVAQAAAPPTFGPVTRVAELCSNDSDNPGSISPDGLTIYLESRRNGIDDRLWCATRPSLTSPFGPLSDSVFTNIRADPANDPASPVISADGLELFFAHSIGTGPQRIFRSVRADVNSAFGVGTEVASIQVGDITRPSWLSADGLRLYFHAVDRRWDLYVAERPSRASAFTAPTKTAFVNVNTYWGNQMEAVLTPDETQVFFSSDEGPGLGYRDIWWASRPDRYSQFGAPVNLTDINSGQDDTTPLWFGDGLFFASTRGTSGGWWQLEVFRAEVVPEPSSLVMLALAAAAGAGVALRRRKPYRQPDQTR